MCSVCLPFTYAIGDSCVWCSVRLHPRRVSPGRAALTARAYPADGAAAAWVMADTDTVVNSIDAHDMGCGWV